jgi:hypothetical protein
MEKMQRMTQPEWVMAKFFISIHRNPHFGGSRSLLSFL